MPACMSVCQLSKGISLASSSRIRRPGTEAICVKQSHFGCQGLGRRHHAPSAKDWGPATVEIHDVEGLVRSPRSHCSTCDYKLMNRFPGFCNAWTPTQNTSGCKIYSGRSPPRIVWESLRKYGHRKCVHDGFVVRRINRRGFGVTKVPVLMAKFTSYSFLMPSTLDDGMHCLRLLQTEPSLTRTITRQKGL